jgi:hypothetical protein
MFGVSSYRFYRSRLLLAKLLVISLTERETPATVREALQCSPEDLNRADDEITQRIDHDIRHLAHLAHIFHADWFSKAEAEIALRCFTYLTRKEFETLAESRQWDFLRTHPLQPFLNSGSAPSECRLEDEVQSFLKLAPKWILFWMAHLDSNMLVAPWKHICLTFRSGRLQKR